MEPRGTTLLSTIINGYYARHPIPSELPSRIFFEKRDLEVRGHPSNLVHWFSPGRLKGHFSLSETLKPTLQGRTKVGSSHRFSNSTRPGGPAGQRFSMVYLSGCTSLHLGVTSSCAIIAHQNLLRTAFSCRSHRS